MLFYPVIWSHHRQGSSADLQVRNRTSRTDGLGKILEPRIKRIRSGENSKRFLFYPLCMLLVCSSWPGFNFSPYKTELNFTPKNGGKMQTWLCRLWHGIEYLNWIYYSTASKLRIKFFTFVSLSFWQANKITWIKIMSFTEPAGSYPNLTRIYPTKNHSQKYYVKLMKSCFRAEFFRRSRSWNWWK